MVKGTFQIKDIVDDFITGLRGKNIKVNRLILYGSHVNGRPGPQSDIDIAVISSSFDNKSLLKRQELLGEVIFLLKEPIEAIGYSYEQFQPAKAKIS